MRRLSTAMALTAALCGPSVFAAVTDMNAGDQFEFNVYASVNVGAITAWNGGSAGKQNFTPVRVAYDGSSNLYVGVWDNDWATTNPSGIIKVENATTAPVATMTGMEYSIAAGTPLTSLDYYNGNLIAGYCSNPYAFDHADSFVKSYKVADGSTNWTYVGDGNNVGHQPTSGAAYNPVTGATTFLSMGYTFYEIDDAGAVAMTSKTSLKNAERPMGVLSLDFDSAGNAAYLDYSLGQGDGGLTYAKYDEVSDTYTTETIFTFTGTSAFYSNKGYDVALINVDEDNPLFAVSILAGTTLTTNTGVTMNDAAVYIVNAEGQLVATAAEGWANAHGVDFVNDTLVVANAHSEVIEFISVSVPEPASMLLLGLGGLSLLARRRK